MSSLAGTDGDDESTKKRQRVSPGQQTRETKKTKTDEADEEMVDVEEDGEDPLSTILEMTKKIDRWAFNQQTKMKGLSKTQVANLGDLVAKIETCVAKAREDRGMEGRMEERGDILKILREATTRTAPPTAGTAVGDYYLDDHDGFQFPPLGSFSSAVKKKKIPKVTGVEKAALGRPNQVLMTMDGKDAEDTRKEIKIKINPSTVGVNVRKIFNTKKGVVIEVDQPDEVDKLLDSQILRTAGIKMEKPKLKRPIIMVYDVPAEMTEQEVKEDIYKRNVGEILPQEDFIEGFVLKHKYKAKPGDRGRNAGKDRWVVECSGPVRNLLRQKERIFLGWEACRVKDYIDLLRCYKCQQHGHVAKVCRANAEVCSHCSESHRYKDCPDSRDHDKIRCSNCRKNGDRDDHDVGWRGCPCYLRMVRRYTQSVDYE